MSEIFGNDIFFKIMDDEVEKILETHENTSGIRAKAKVLTDAYARGIVRYIGYVKNMKDDEFDTFQSNRMNEISNLAKKNNQKLLELSSKKTDSDLQSSIALAMEPDNDFMENLGIKLDELNLDIEDYKKLFILDFTNKIESLQMIIGMSLDIWPLIEIDTIVKKHFDSDYQWPLAVSILTTQENLVKKKLIDLGMNKKEIDEFLKQKNNHFSQLVELLAEKIQFIEKRNVNLSFFKSSALREVRNKIEHEGFQVKVTQEDVSGLLADLMKFEKELFPCQ